MEKRKFRRWRNLKVGSLYLLYFECEGRHFLGFDSDPPTYPIVDLKERYTGDRWSPGEEYTPVLILDKKENCVVALIGELIIHIGDYPSLTDEDEFNDLEEEDDEDEWEEEDEWETDWDARFASIDLIPSKQSSNTHPS